MTLDKDYSIDEVAEAIGMSKRWIYAQIKEGAEHQFYGNTVRFTAAQVDLLREQHTRAKVQVPASITTGHKRRAS
jgi:predicted DNA-binding protein YlxM (UPF0122 family)